MSVQPISPPWYKSRLTPFLGYGSGDFALNLFWQGTGFYLFFFFTNVIGIPASTVGILFLIASLWDAVSDPMMGYIAERTNSRWGPYRPYLLFGCVPLGASFALMFTPLHPGDSDTAILYAGAALILFRTTYTIVSIPYATLGARITRNFDMRTRLAGIRMYFGFLGGVSISFLAKQLQQVYDDSAAFQYMGLTAGAAAVIVLVLCFLTTRESSNPINRHAPPHGARASLGALFKNRPFFLIAGGISLVTIANTTVGQTMLYFFETNVGDRAAGNNAIIIMSAAPLATIPFWSFVTLRIGKKNAWLGASLIAILGLGLLFAAADMKPAVAFTGITIAVFGLSAYAVIFWSMLPDTIEYGHHHTGVASESFLIGVASSFQKLSIGLSAFILGHLLERTGYQPDVAVDADTAGGVLDIFTLIPAAALLVSAALILLYPITAKSHAAMVGKLSRSETDREHPK